MTMSFTYQYVEKAHKKLDHQKFKALIYWTKDNNTLANKIFMHLNGCSYEQAEGQKSELIVRQMTQEAYQKLTQATGFYLKTAIVNLPSGFYFVRQNDALILDYDIAFSYEASPFAAPIEVQQETFVKESKEESNLLLQEKAPIKDLHYDFFNPINCIPQPIVASTNPLATSIEKKPLALLLHFPIVDNIKEFQETLINNLKKKFPDSKLLIQLEAVESEKRKIEAFEKEIKATEERVANLNQEIKTHSESFTKINEELQKTETATNEINSEISLLKDNIQESGNKKETHIRTFEKQMQDLNNKAREKFKEISEIAKIQNDIINNDSIIPLEINQIDKMTALSNEVKKIEEERKSTISFYTNEIDNLDTHIKSSHEKLDELTNKNEDFQIQIKKIKHKQDEINDNLRIKQEELLYQEEKLPPLKSDLKNTQDSLEKIAKIVDIISSYRSPITYLSNPDIIQTFGQYLDFFYMVFNEYQDDKVKIDKFAEAYFSPHYLAFYIPNEKEAQNLFADWDKLIKNDKKNFVLWMDFFHHHCTHASNSELKEVFQLFTYFTQLLKEKGITISDKKLSVEGISNIVTWMGCVTWYLNVIPDHERNAFFNSYFASDMQHWQTLNILNEYGLTNLIKEKIFTVEANDLIEEALQQFCEVIHNNSIPLPIWLTEAYLREFAKTSIIQIFIHESDRFKNLNTPLKKNAFIYTTLWLARQINPSTIQFPPMDILNNLINHIVNLNEDKLIDFMKGMQKNYSSLNPSQLYQLFDKTLANQRVFYRDKITVNSPLEEIHHDEWLVANEFDGKTGTKSKTQEIRNYLNEMYQVISQNENLSDHELRQLFLQTGLHFSTRLAVLFECYYRCFNQYPSLPTRINLLNIAIQASSSPHYQIRIEQSNDYKSDHDLILQAVFITQQYNKRVVLLFSDSKKSQSTLLQFKSFFNYLTLSSSLLTSYSSPEALNSLICFSSQVEYGIFQSRNAPSESEIILLYSSTYQPMSFDLHPISVSLNDRTTEQDRWFYEMIYLAGKDNLEKDAIEKWLTEKGLSHPTRKAFIAQQSIDEWLLAYKQMTSLTSADYQIIETGPHSLLSRVIPRLSHTLHEGMSDLEFPFKVHVLLLERLRREKDNLNNYQYPFRVQDQTDLKMISIKDEENGKKYLFIQFFTSHTNKIPMEEGIEITAPSLLPKALTDHKKEENWELNEQNMEEQSNAIPSHLPRALQHLLESLPPAFYPFFNDEKWPLAIGKKFQADNKLLYIFNYVNALYDSQADLWAALCLYALDKEWLQKFLSLPNINYFFTSSIELSIYDIQRLYVLENLLRNEYQNYLKDNMSISKLVNYPHHHKLLHDVYVISSYASRSQLTKNESPQAILPHVLFACLVIYTGKGNVELENFVRELKQQISEGKALTTQVILTFTLESLKGSHHFEWFKELCDNRSLSKPSDFALSSTNITLFTTLKPTPSPSPAISQLLSYLSPQASIFNLSEGEYEELADWRSVNIPHDQIKVDLHYQGIYSVPDKDFIDEQIYKKLESDKKAYPAWDVSLRWEDYQCKGLPAIQIEDTILTEGPSYDNASYLFKGMIKKGSRFVFCVGPQEEKGEDKYDHYYKNFRTVPFKDILKSFEKYYVPNDLIEPSPGELVCYEYTSTSKAENNSKPQTLYVININSWKDHHPAAQFNEASMKCLAVLFHHLVINKEMITAHCSAGVNRSACWLVVYHLFKQFVSGKGQPINLFKEMNERITRMREKKHPINRDKEQLKFSVSFLQELLKTLKSLLLKQDNQIKFTEGVIGKSSNNNNARLSS